MFTIIGLLVILIWFYLAAKDARKSKALWMLIGFILYMFLGVLFLKFTEMYILQTDTIAEVYKYRVPKLLLQFVSFLLILVAAYGVQSKFLKRKTS
ncbi:MAG: hypothetical protein Q8L04_05735 [Ignavibacteria bacterium]|nr:hypothetical protein [Ignavibacteria bacterium]